ncbi:hypothetical protein C8J56DRAFT_1170787 [Mycena floridula]|nr:hypothetical protein C8J56DRAFT_1170787 [Mycena floridula]
MPSNFQERVNTTNAIRGILESYPLGNGLLRELIQNSDDAGAASQVFILDHRTHATKTLLDPSLSGSQGPALLAVNNTQFSESDFNALSTINGSNKTTDESKTGKYGLGLRSAYHITENLHVLSGNKLVIFDPQQRFAGDICGGGAINIREERNLYSDQLEAFSSAMEGGRMPGTVIRLPLRTPKQAKASGIKPTAVRPKEIQTLFTEFIKKEMDITLLFLKNLTSIELREVDAKGKVTVHAKVEIDDKKIISKRQLPRRVSGGCTTNFTLTISTTLGSKTATRRTWRVHHAISDNAVVQEKMLKRVFYEASDLADNKLIAHVAIAYPLDGTPIQGRLFTALPLPIFTGFPVHIHGIFALTPDRQSLRNSQELGLGDQSKERMLVEWNKTVFEDFLPPVWESLFSTLVNEDSIAIWKAWPRVQSRESYWGSIPYLLLQYVFYSKQKLFPTTTKEIIPFSLGLIVTPEDATLPVIDVLSRLGLPLIVPPSSFVQTIQEMWDPSEYPAFSPSSVHEKLFTKPYLAKLSASSADHKATILAYLIASGVENIVGLPIMPCIGGSHAALCFPEAKTVRHVLVSTKDEAELFAGCTNKEMILLNSMPAKVRKILSDPNTSTAVNVQLLDVHHIAECLQKRFWEYSLEDEVSGSDATSNFEWLSQFWKWMNSLDDGHRFISELAPHLTDLHLLPTTNNTLRKVSDTVVHPVTPAVMKAFGELGVPFLHDSIPVAVLHRSKIVVIEADDIGSLMEVIEKSRIKKLTAPSLTRIKTHITALLNRCESPPLFTEQQKSVFARLPIFPVRLPLIQKKTLSTVELGPAVGNCVFVKVTNSCAIPVIKGTVFIDVSSSLALSSALEPNVIGVALDELGVLELAVHHLESQTPANLDALVSRLIPRLTDLSEEGCGTLRKSRFVTVEESMERCLPSDVIDPKSKLAVLFKGESSKFPQGLLAGKLLPILQTHHFFSDALNGDIVAERLQYISANQDTDNPAVLEKAKELLRLMDHNWSVEFGQSPLISTTKWIPTSAGWRRPADCRSRKAGLEIDLFDQVLGVLEVEVHDSNLRNLLGWDEGLPFQVLLDQFARTLAAQTIPRRSARLSALIIHLSHLLGEGHLQQQDLVRLKQVITDKPWIPIRTKLHCTREVLLCESKLGTFKVLPEKFSDCVQFLREMGCLDSPDAKSLLTEIELLAKKPSGSSTTEAIEILQALADADGYAEVDELSLLVPDLDGKLRQSQFIYFPDSTSASNWLPGAQMFAAHPDISKSLATKLRLKFLSSLLLGDGGEEDEDEEDSEDMHEDIMTRIQGILKDYDIQYVFNEFFANAADAGARSFTALLDERTFNSKSLLSRDMAPFQGPSLVLHNDAVFSEADFKGIRRIGTGSKTDNPDTIGRYGLGAISLLHFSEMVFILSKEHLLILDPSGLHLPPRRGKPRTALLRRIADIASHYPDQLSVFEDLFGCSVRNGSYEGTLFRLPLRTTMSISECLNLVKQSAYSLAEDALFFTELRQIQAQRRPPKGVTRLLWSVALARSRARETMHRSGINSFYSRKLELLKTESGNEKKEIWLIARLAVPIPEQHKAQLKSGTRNIAMNLAVQLEPEERRSGHLFSSLRLPVETSFPVHINAPFALAPDRRSIRFDPPDKSHNRPPQSAYNFWLLSDCIPLLYMFAIYWQCSSSQKQSTWWPVEDSDEISRTVIQALHEQVPTCSLELFWSLDGQSVRPCDAVFCAKEPGDVGRVLKVLKPRNLVSLPFKVRLKLLDGETQLRLVDGPFLAQQLQAHAPTLAARFPDESLHPLLNDIVVYLLDAEVAFEGLPVLLNKQGHLTVAGAQSSPLYWCKTDSSSAPFHSKHFLHPEFYEVTTVDRMIEAGVNVSLFDATAVGLLLNKKFTEKSTEQHSREVSQWIMDFWKSFNQLPKEIETAVFDQLPLIPTHKPLSFLSMKHCLAAEEQVLAKPPKAFKSLVQTLGIVVFMKPVPLKDQLPSYSFARMLKCLKSHIAQLPTLSTANQQKLAKLIREQVRKEDEISQESKDILCELPIWSAFIDSRAELVSLLEAQEKEFITLPKVPKLSVLAKFFRSDVIVLESDATMTLVDNAESSLPQIVRGLDLPVILPQDQLTDFALLVRTMLLTDSMDLPGNSFKVPNTALKLEFLDQLYDHSIPLFAECLPPSSFIHPTMRELSPRLRRYGLIHRISYQCFLECAYSIHNAVNRALTQNPVIPVELVDRAKKVYQCYNRELPNLLGEQWEWDALKNLSFIPRNVLRCRRNRTTYDAEVFGGALPAILPPCLLLRESLESIAWTQRGLFQTGLEFQPSDSLTTVNPSFGVPEPEEVVKHLRELILNVAPVHNRNRSLLVDIRATYRWLSELPDAGARLAGLINSDETLFLNIDDPERDAWTFCRASQIVRDLPYDRPGHVRVRDFLTEFWPLLAAAGAKRMTAAQYVEVEADTMDEETPGIEAQFNDLRKAGRMTDIVLLPAETEGQDMSRLRAHSVFLAVTIPHLRDAFTGGWRQAGDNYLFEGSYSSACAILDFVYTGEFHVDKPANSEDAMLALHDLLDLLEVTDRWNLEGLKRRVQKIIVEDLELISADTYRMILDSATKYNAPALKLTCENFATANQELLAPDDAMDI